MPDPLLKIVNLTYYGPEAAGRRPLLLRKETAWTDNTAKTDARAVYGKKPEATTEPSFGKS